FAGASTASLGYLGIILGAAFAGLVYFVIAVIVKVAGVGWINKIMPPVVIGPTVAIIGLSLSSNAVSDMMKGSVTAMQSVWTVKEVGGVMQAVETTQSVSVASPYIAMLCGLVTLVVVIICTVYGNKTLKLIPFIIGILAGYALASIFTVIGNVCNVDALKIIDFGKFANMEWVPSFAFLKAFSGDYGDQNIGAYIGTIAVAYVPVAFVVFAEHIADHKNLSSIIGADLTENPGLTRTLLGDGVGSMVGAFFGGCPNTTYGESVGCVAITGNASVSTTALTAIMAILLAFFKPFIAFVNTIPTCVVGGICIALYGFIAVSGLKMLKNVDLGENENLFVVSAILVTGIGGLVLQFGQIQISSIATALIVGILTKLIVGGKKKTAVADENKENKEAK
ncbi:MAG: solute carrier family 23 protein, partial [Eubacteriales bacterium]|nr:solute carrier family 23 protein [Eubacteriales bacterium]